MESQICAHAIEIEERPKLAKSSGTETPEAQGTLYMLAATQKLNQTVSSRRRGCEPKGARNHFLLHFLLSDPQPIKKHERPPLVNTHYPPIIFIGVIVFLLTS